MADFYPLIKEWYRQNKRDLPWRNTTDPYKIWLSEIILQQTRVDQGLSYYLKFLESFPTVKDLAEASEQDVLNLWQGLGYYSRARNLHFTANLVSNELNGIFPKSYIELLKLKGIGSYTAAAIASFAYKEPKAVVDGNVYRVLSRVFNIDTSIDSSEGKKQFFNLAQSLIDLKEPDIFNQAIMEFGALQCVPNNPDCSICPLQTKCLAFEAKSVKSRPLKSKKNKVRNRYFHFMLFMDNDYTYLEQRKTKDIWENMYQFPLIETSETSETLEINDWKKYSDTIPDFISKEIIHLLSHQRIHAKFYHFSRTPKMIESSWLKVKKCYIQDFPIPRLIDRYLELVG